MSSDVLHVIVAIYHVLNSSDNLPNPAPAQTVFGIGLDNPQPMAKGKKRKVFFPGQGAP